MRDPPESGGDDRRRELPRGPLLPPRRDRRAHYQPRRRRRSALLAKHFLARFAREMNARQGFAPGALSATRALALAGQRARAGEQGEARGDHGRRQIDHGRGSTISARPARTGFRSTQGGARGGRSGRDPQGLAETDGNISARQAARDQPADALTTCSSIRPVCVTRAAPFLALTLLLAACGGGGAAYARGLPPSRRGICAPPGSSS